MVWPTLGSRTAKEQEVWGSAVRAPVEIELGNPIKHARARVFFVYKSFQG